MGYWLKAKILLTHDIFLRISLTFSRLKKYYLEVWTRKILILFPILFSSLNPNSDRSMMVEASLVNTVEAIGILIGVTIAIKELRDIDKTQLVELETRQLQLQMNILRQTRTMEFLGRYMQIVYVKNSALIPNGWRNMVHALIQRLIQPTYMSPGCMKI